MQLKFFHFKYLRTNKNIQIFCFKCTLRDVNFHKNQYKNVS